MYVNRVAGALITAAVLAAAWTGIARASAVDARHFEVPNLAPDGMDGLATGSDGTVWTLDDNDRIWSVRTRGLVKRVPLPGPPNANGMAIGSDGSLYVGGGWLRRITGAGKVNRVAPEQLCPDEEWYRTCAPLRWLDLTTSPSGDIWATAVRDGARISQFVPSTGDVREFALGEMNLEGIARGSDGNIWFAATESDYSTGTVGARGKIARMTPAGLAEYFPAIKPLPPDSGFFMHDFIAGNDDALWYSVTTYRDAADGTVDDSTRRGAIYRMTMGGQAREFALPRGVHFAGSLTAGPRRSVWFSAGIRTIARIASNGEIERFRVRGLGRWDLFDDFAFDDQNRLWFTRNHFTKNNMRGDGGSVGYVRFNKRQRQRLGLR